MAAEFIEVLSIKEFANSSEGSLKNSDLTDIKCDAKVKISYKGTTYWLPLYAQTV